MNVDAPSALGDAVKGDDGFGAVRGHFLGELKLLLFIGQFDLKHVVIVERERGGPDRDGKRPRRVRFREQRRKQAGTARGQGDKDAQKRKAKGGGSRPVPPSRPRRALTCKQRHLPDHFPLHLPPRRKLFLTEGGAGRRGTPASVRPQRTASDGPSSTCKLNDFCGGSPAKGLPSAPSKLTQGGGAHDTYKQWRRSPTGGSRLHPRVEGLWRWRASGARSRGVCAKGWRRCGFWPRRWCPPTSSSICSPAH